ncbi:hypothetical protein BC834DRAFT_841543 [Gloeopeniophorella convolvens]|nr:hypothetical protein BC834DRAFT_841543 [Gloeopeniophorella convolvens]
MASKAYEVVFWPANDAYRNDQSVISPAFKFITDAKAEAIFHGRQVEEPNLGAVVGAKNSVTLLVYQSLTRRSAAWNDIQDHKNLVADTVARPKVMKLLKATMAGGRAEMVHVNFTADPTPAFKASVTEFAFVKPNSPEDKLAVQDHIDRIVAWANDPSTVASGGARGSPVERPEEYLLVIGWPSVEAHVEALKTEVGDVVTRLRKQAVVKLRHVPLSSYTSLSSADANGRSRL